MDFGGPERERNICKIECRARSRRVVKIYGDAAAFGSGVVNAMGLCG
jgi:hypothetical protein